MPEKRFISQMTKKITNLSSIFHLMKARVSSRLPLGRSKVCRVPKGLPKG